MKKLVLLLGFVFALGLFSVDAQVSKKEAGKSPAKTEKVVKKKTMTKKVVKPVKKTSKKVAATPAK